MLKKYLSVIFIVICFISIKDILCKQYKNHDYINIMKQFEREEESAQSISPEFLYKYKEFLDKNGIIFDEFIVDTYIKYGDNTIIKEDEKNIKNSIDKSEYLNSKILGAELLYKYYLENNNYDEAKNLIINIFNKIKEKEFKNNSNEINYFLDVIKSEPKDKVIVIQILEELLENDNIIDIIRLKIYDELRFLYISVNNYALASEVSIKALIISTQQNLKEETAEGLIELAMLFKRLDGIESGIELIKKSLEIEVEDEFTNADLKTYALLTLGELYLSIDDCNSAKLALEQIPNYKDSIPIDIYRDIEIIKYNMDSRIAIMEGNLNLAKEYLDNSKYLQEINENDYYVGKEISYLLALGNFYEESHQYNEAINLYTTMLNENKDNKYLVEQILQQLISVEKDSNKKNGYYQQLLELRETEESERYGDYTYYILDKIDNENELIEKNRSIINKSRINVFLTLIGGLIIGVLFNKINSIKIKGKQDVLVNAYNRKYFDIIYKKLLNKNKKFSIIILDLDNFKSINDNFGHQLGDIVLINTCKAIQPLLDEKSSLFRYGGEEFVAIVEDKSREEVLELAEAIRRKVESLHWEEDIVTTVSIGVAYSENEGRNILKKADEKLYISKRTGKNKVTQ